MLKTGFVHTLMENLEKSWKKLKSQKFWKSPEMCYNHMFIYAEFKIINMFTVQRDLHIKDNSLIKIINTIYMCI